MSLYKDFPHGEPLYRNTLYEELKKYGESDFYPYHMPGHKRRTVGRMPEQVLQIDITEIDGFDNLHQAEGLLQRAQERANALYHADETFYLVNGSTGGILSAVSAVLPEGGRLLIARNCHKSVYHAAYLRHLRLSYIYPEAVPGFEFCEAVTAEQVRLALERQPDIGAVLIVSPTYEGRIADVRAIADVVHEKDIPLIVDEAHGAHLGMAEGFAPGSCTQGADLVIHSVHKTLTAMTQTALLHVNGKLVERDRLRRFLRIYQSSSPSYVLMASIDEAMDFLEKEGERRFAWFLQAYRGLVQRLEACWVLRVVPWREAQMGRQDIGKLAIYCPVSAKLLYDMLRDSYHLQCEMVAENYCLAMFTLADGQEAYDRMEKALLEIDGMLWKLQDKDKDADSEGMLQHGESPKKAVHDGIIQDAVNHKGSIHEGENEGLESYKAEFREGMPYELAPQGKAQGTPSDVAPDIRLDLCEAWDKPWRREKLASAVGEVMAEFINLYPPGIPLLVPGEVLTAELYAQILAWQAEGLSVQGMEEAGHVRVIVHGGTPRKPGA